MSYQGVVRVLDTNGMLLDVGPGQLEGDGHEWGGTVEVSAGSNIAGKALQVVVEIPGGGRGQAILRPSAKTPDALTTVHLVGVGAAPF